MIEKWFKVISKDLKAKDGGNFDYAPFVKSKEWLPIIIDLKLCNTGYHVTKYWNMFFDNKDCRVFEVMPKGLVEEEALVGVVDKAVCSSFKIIKEFKPQFDNNRNTGKWNTGDSNAGYSNTGDSNAGKWNTGDWNTGYRNTGGRNTGDRNTGYWNTGYWNTGNRNTGNRNTGDSNTGDWNTGNWNTANYHTGAFNTKKAEIVFLFDKKINKKDYDKICFPNYFYFELNTILGYKGSWKKAFDNASVEEVKNTIKLPNFDFLVFNKITRITKKMIMKKLAGVEQKK